MPDDDLSLVPIDDDADRPLAPFDPEEIFEPDETLVPVICGACRARLYAPVEYVGLWMICPDCGKRNEIYDVPPKFRFVAEISENGGYDVVPLDEKTLKAKAMPLKDYTAPGDTKPLVLPPEERVFDDRPQLLDGVVNRLLTSRQEKEREARIREKQQKAAEEMYEINQAARNGVLDKFVTEKFSSDPKPAAPSARSQAPVPPPLPASATSPPVSPQNKAVTQTPKRSASLDDEPIADESAVSFFFAPFFAAHNRPRLLFLCLVGILAFFFSEKARSIFYMVIFERGEPGEIISRMEQLTFYLNFVPGVFLLFLWVAVTLLMAVSVYLDTAAGSRSVTHWLPFFKLGDGLAYLLWVIVFLLIAAAPGYLLWFLTCVSHDPDPQAILRSAVMQGVLMAGSGFLFFPVVFLSVMETETFNALGLPHKTFGLFRRRPWAWGRFYLLSGSMLGVVGGSVVSLIVLNFLYEKSPFMQGPLYYVVAGIVFGLLPTLGTLCYFRLLGLLGWEMEETAQSEAC